MNASVAEQTHIFEAALDGAELEALNSLISRHKANTALTQQMALDASKLVSTSQERLSQQAGAGFFKRFANAISGKTGVNQLQNQNDMLRMQKFAWHYLQQLQQQNLINAQSIAVIRNNLGTMNAYIIETRDFLEQAIDRIDGRLRHVENNTSFNNWALGIEANKRRLKSHPRMLLTLRLTYDFMRSHPGILLSERDVSNYLVNTLEKLDVNCDEEIELLDFISDVIDQVELTGVEQFRSAIALTFDDHVVDSEFIQKNIAGTGLNALYFLSDHYERIVDLINDEMVDSDDKRTSIIANFFGREFAELTTVYSLRHLICEIIGGCQVAIAVYKDANGLNVTQEKAGDAPQLDEHVPLVSSLPDIHAHTFFDGPHSAEAKRDYLLSLALCVDNAATLTPLALEFIALLSAKAGHGGVQAEFSELADNPRKLLQYQATLPALLDDEDKKLTWLLDAFFLLGLASAPIESPPVKAVLGIIKPAHLKDWLPSLMALVHEGDSSQVLEAALKLAPVTGGWKNLVRYRALRFDAYFDAAQKGVGNASMANLLFMMELGKVQMKSLEHAYFFSYSDGSFMDNLAQKAAATLCSQGRKSTLAELNLMRKRASDLLSEHRVALSRANNLVARWGIPAFEFKDDISYADYELDNSAENEDWSSHFDAYFYQIQNTLDAFERACSEMGEQLGFFAAGEFDKSVFALKEERRAQRMLQEQQEKLEKQSIPITRDGVPHRFGIDWKTVANAPCNPEKISHIETNGKIWLIAASIDSEDVFFRSEDGEHWQRIEVDTPQYKVWLDDIRVVNGVWIIHNRALRSGTRDEGIYYSTDALQWRHALGPAGTDSHLSHKALHYFKDMWLWEVTLREKYSYTEKGFFTDSTKTDSYRKTVLYAAKDLGGPWERWADSPSFNDGVEVNAICALPGNNALLAFCEYSSSYVRNKKRPESPPYVMYFGAARSWQTCAWDGDRYRYNQPVFVQYDDRMLCFSAREVLTSPKGYDWKRQETQLSVDTHVALPMADLFFERSGNTVHLSQDGQQFKELVLDDGTWRYLAASADAMIGVHYENRHEETVLRIGRFRCTRAS